MAFEHFNFDRDLLQHEPNLFSDGEAVAQKLVNVSDGALAGTTLTSATADFDATMVSMYHVVRVGDRLCEVALVQDAGTLTVSLPRANAADDPIPPGDGTDLAVTVLSFDAQIAAAHQELITKMARLLRVSAATIRPGLIDTAEAARIERLLTAEKVIRGVMSAGAEHHEQLEQAAARYRRDARCAWRGAHFAFDFDQDGHIDAILEPGHGVMKRV